MKDLNRFNQLQKIYSVFNSFSAEKDNGNSELWKLFGSTCKQPQQKLAY